MQSHPLDGDGATCELFKLLGRESKMSLTAAQLPFRIPDTVLYYGCASFWYYYSEDTGTVQRYPAKALEKTNILRKFTSRLYRSAGGTGIAGSHDVPSDDDVGETDISRGKAHRQLSDIIAVFVNTESPTLDVTYFTRESLKTFLFADRKDLHGFLQMFVEPRLDHCDIVQVLYSPAHTFATRRVNRSKIYDLSVPPHQRCCGFDGPVYQCDEHYCLPHVSEVYRQMCEGLISFFAHVDPRHRIDRLVAYFRQDARERYWLLFTTSIRTSELDDPELQELTVRQSRATTDEGRRMWLKHMKRPTSSFSQRTPVNIEPRMVHRQSSVSLTAVPRGANMSYESLSNSDSQAITQSERVLASERQKAVLSKVRLVSDQLLGEASRKNHRLQPVSLHVTKRNEPDSQSLRPRSAASHGVSARLLSRFFTSSADLENDSGDDNSHQSFSCGRVTRRKRILQHKHELDAQTAAIDAQLRAVQRDIVAASVGSGVPSVRKRVEQSREGLDEGQIETVRERLRNISNRRKQPLASRGDAKISDNQLQFAESRSSTPTSQPLAPTAVVEPEITRMSGLRIVQSHRIVAEHMRGQSAAVCAAVSDALYPVGEVLKLVKRHMAARIAGGMQSDASLEAIIRASGVRIGALPRAESEDTMVESSPLREAAGITHEINMKKKVLDEEYHRMYLEFDIGANALVTLRDEIGPDLWAELHLEKQVELSLAEMAFKNDAKELRLLRDLQKARSSGDEAAVAAVTSQLDTLHLDTSFTPTAWDAGALVSCRLIYPFPCGSSFTLAAGHLERKMSENAEIVQKIGHKRSQCLLGGVCGPARAAWAPKGNTSVTHQQLMADMVKAQRAQQTGAFYRTTSVASTTPSEQSNANGKLTAKPTSSPSAFKSASRRASSGASREASPAVSPANSFRTQRNERHMPPNESPDRRVSFIAEESRQQTVDDPPLNAADDCEEPDQSEVVSPSTAAESEEPSNQAERPSNSSPPPMGDALHEMKPAEGALSMQSDSVLGVEPQGAADITSCDETPAAESTPHDKAVTPAAKEAKSPTGELPEGGALPTNQATVDKESTPAVEKADEEPSWLLDM